jgi:hypothetical protein
MQIRYSANCQILLNIYNQPSNAVNTINSINTTNSINSNNTINPKNFNLEPLTSNLEHRTALM